jgi:hypothetical protein
MSLKFVNKATVPAGEDTSQPVVVLTDKETTALVETFIQQIFSASGLKYISAAKYLVDTDTIIKLRFTTTTIDPDTFDSTNTTEDFALLGSDKITVAFDNTAKSIKIATSATRGNLIPVASKDNLPETGEAGFQYVTLDTKNLYFWNTDKYVEIIPIEIGTQVLTDKTYAQPTDTDNLAEIISFEDPITGVAGSMTFNWAGDGLKFAYDEDTKKITISAAITTTTDGMLSGAGTADSPLAITITTDSSIIGNGLPATPFKVNIQHNETLTGVGTEANKLGVSINVDGNPLYGNSIYLGIDNQYLIGSGVGSLYGPQVEGAPTPGAGALIVQNVQSRVRIRTSATTPTDKPYVYNGEDAYITFIRPLNGGSGKYELDAVGVRWHEYDKNGALLSTVTLAANGYWIPNIEIIGVYSFGTWSPQSFSGFWSADFNSAYPGGDTPPPDYDNYDPKLLFDIWNYHSVNEHIADDTRHLVDGERAKWNQAVTDLSTHEADTVKHITADERDAWDAKAEVSDITTAVSAEEKARKEADVLLQAAIDGIEDMGRWIGTAETYADLVNTNPYWQPSVNFAPDVNDFATVQADETHGEGVTYYRVTNVAGTTGAWQLTFQYEFTSSTDMSGKINKITNPTAGNIPIIDSGGGLTGTSIDPDTFASATALTTHINDTVKHITAAERTAWNAKASAQSVTDEATARADADTALGQRITDAIATIKGRYLGTFATDALIPSSITGAVIGDFILVANDDTSGSNNTLYRITAINSGAITWTKDFVWENSSINTYIYRRELTKLPNRSTSYDGTATIPDVSQYPQSYFDLILKDESATIRFILVKYNSGTAYDSDSCLHLMRYFLTTKTQRVSYIYVGHYSGYTTVDAQDTRHDDPIGGTHDSNQWTRNFGTNNNSPLNTWMPMEDAHNQPMSMLEFGQFIVIFPTSGNYYEFTISDTCELLATENSNTKRVPYIKVTKIYSQKKTTIAQADREIVIE